jgi:hypothetical protein
LTVAVFFALGAVLNVFFAWWFLETAPRGIPLEGIHVLKREWPKPAPAGWPDCYHAVRSETDNWGGVWAYSVPGTDHEMRTLECGRPFLSLQAWSFDHNDGKGEQWFYLLRLGDKQRGLRLPWFPLWPGFALNTLFYAGLAWGLWQVPLAIRRRRRRRMNRCVKCGYDRAGIAADAKCPECGH